VASSAIFASPTARNMKPTSLLAASIEAHTPPGALANVIAKIETAKRLRRFFSSSASNSASLRNKISFLDGSRSSEF